MKECATCRVPKPETEFYPNYRFRSRAASCKLCMKDRAIKRQQARLAVDRQRRMAIRAIDDAQVRMILRALDKYPARQARVLAVYEARLRRIA